MSKAWSVLFAAVLLAEFGMFVAAAFVPGWWLPKGVSTFSGEVDALFYLILGMTGFFFVLTETILVYNMWRFTDNPEHKPVYTHGNHRLEMFWTAIPAILLVLIAVLQIRAWEKIKYQSRMPDPEKKGEEHLDQAVQVTARQWEWRIRHSVPSRLDSEIKELERLPTKEQGEKVKAFDVVPYSPRGWADHPEIDDVHLVNELHTWKGARVKIYLKTMDVIHSFFLPNLRLKQDVLPGKTIPMWFSVTEANMVHDEETGTWKHVNKPDLTFEFTCAELCGARHYAMRGRLCVHETKEDYLRWLHKASQNQKSTQPETRTGSLTSLVDRDR